MKCSKCDKEAVVIKSGNSLCDDHKEDKEEGLSMGEKLTGNF